MDRPEWDDLTEQLRDAPNPKARRKACQKLAATGDPEVIPFLRNAYLQDEDDRVREAARKALARFKAQQQGKTVRRLPISDRSLRLVFGALVALFIVSLGLHGLTVLSQGNGPQEEPHQGSIFDQTPTDRTSLVALIRRKLADVQNMSANLHSEIQQYNDLGHVVCDFEYEIPEPIALAEIDQVTYPDLRIVAGRIDATLPGLEKALVLLKGACATPSAQTERVIQASIELDNVDVQLRDAARLLQNAIESPAPTVGPTMTPLPTPTPSPIPSATPPPPTGTGLPEITTTPAEPTTEPSTPTPSSTPTATPTETVTPSPTATLPLPDLDYPSILRALRERYIVMGDLTNNYGTGMIDQWTTVQNTGQTSTSFCQLSTWPSAFDFTPEQRALLDAPDAADPMLEDAVRLQQEGLQLALQARALFEADCLQGSLVNSATTGLTLANDAWLKLAQSQALYDTIRARPES